MSTTLLVPVQIDALCLEKDQLAVEAKADFSLLPFQKDGVDHNPNSLNISETILSHEFENLNLNLKKGIHLHWALPDGLTMGVQDENNQITFPQIPNRWLVTKYIDDKQADQWIIESDYLHPQGANNTYESVSYPVDLTKYEETINSSNPEETPYQPYRYIGRQVPFDGWSESQNADRLSSLTVAGYGTPSFAAFYPNCYSILGFREEDVAVDPTSLNSTQFTVVGWYSESENDPLNRLISNNKDASFEDLRNKIVETFNWEIPEDSDSAPENIVCFGSISFNANGDSMVSSQTSDVEVAIGNSGKEALAAYMAEKFHAEDRNNAEEQLMAIQLNSMVNTTGTDVGPAFRQAFHNDQFSYKNGQNIWVVTIQNNKNNSTDAASSNNKDVSIKLPPKLTHQLNDLNLQQAKFDRDKDQLNGLRHALFSDWYKYMVSAYPPSDELGTYPDLNLIAYYIREKSIPDLENLINQTGDLSVIKDNTGKRIIALEASESGTLASTVSSYFSQLQELLEAFNSGAPEDIYFTGLCNKGVMPEGVVTDSNITWISNTPITDQCLQFSGSNYLSFNIDGTCRGISFWVKINGQQNRDATFFNLTDVANSSIGIRGFGTFWNRVYINGVMLNPDINKDWSSFPKDQWMHVYLESANSFSGSLYLFSADGTREFTNGNLASFRLFTESLSEDDIFTDRNIFQKNQAVVRQQPGPKYYQTKEPVLLFSGDDVTPSLRHGFDGRLHEEDLLSCSINESLQSPLTETDFSTLQEYILANQPSDDVEKIGYQIWENTPWNPFMFEWETAIYPLKKGNDLETSGGSYQTNFIEENFHQEMNQEQLILEKDATVSSNPQLYTGYTIITNQAQINLQSQIIVFLNQQRNQDYVAQFGIDLGAQEQQDSFKAWIDKKPTLTKDNFQEYQDWMETLPFAIPAERENNIISQAVGAYQEVAALTVQSQSLGGFNQALLMYSEALQLPIDDPLGFEDAKSLSKEVASYVGNANKSVAKPLNSFMPLRTGSLKLNRVRIIDTFGQYKDVENLHNLIIPNSMSLQYSFDYGQLYIPPAISQPARLNFRWLAANNGEQEVNSAEGSNPICGWIVPNFMDLSLMVYDQNGYNLGSIDRNAFWQPAPGDSTPLDPRFIQNQYLRKVVKQLSITDGESDATKAQYIIDFINMMDQALTNITPSNFGQQTGTAMLMGRPVAVVRSVLNLEVKGNLAFNQSWNSFRVDLDQDNRTTNDFEKVYFPLRVGDRSQLNDGVIGYWKEDPESNLSDAFYTTIRKEVVVNSNIISFESDRTHLQQSIDSAGQVLTMLIDPNGSVHAHSGVLPTKSITIPSSMYASAIQNINVTFLSAPIITPRNLVAVSLPNEAGFNWSWVAKQGQTWKTVHSLGQVTINDFTSRFSNGLDIWNTLVSNNWISTQDNATARVVAQDQRSTTDLDGAFSTQLVEIQKVLTAAQLNPFSYDGTFKSPVEAIEGWLKLTPQ